MKSRGLFGLKTRSDLLRKLQYEFELFESDPSNAYVAFNFFVTAEHMLEWVFPGSANNAKRSHTKKNEILLQICSHVANGGKHFQVEDKRHHSVSESLATGGHFPRGYILDNYFPKNYFSSGSLSLELTDDAATKYGKTISALALAKHVLNYWEKHTETGESK